MACTGPQGVWTLAPAVVAGVADIGFGTRGFKQGVDLLGERPLGLRGVGTVGAASPRGACGFRAEFLSHKQTQRSAAHRTYKYFECAVNELWVSRSGTPSDSAPLAFVVGVVQGPKAF